MSLRPIVRVDKYTAAGAYTWNKYQGAKWVRVQMIGGGSSGSGAITTTSGSGGGGGGYGELDIPADILGATETVNVGAGGVPVGQPSVSGGSSNFGKYAFVRGGAAAGSGYPSWSVTSAVGHNGATFSSLNSAGIIAVRGGCGGGSGGISTGGNGFAGGSNIPSVAPATAGPGNTGPFSGVAGGAGGVGGNGSDGLDFAGNSAFGGTGGGGGAGSAAGVAGNGGKGGYPGGGGGGGGATTTGTVGIGGAGADGIVIVTTYF